LTNQSSVPLVAKPSAADLELTLGQIRGVYASSVILNQNRDLSEIHVVASTARKPKQIVRDIETLLFVKHRLKIDYRKISLVQLPDENLLRLPMARPEIRRVLEDDLGDRKRIRVEIQGAGRIAVGEAQERIDNPTPFHTGAKAAISGVQRLTGSAIDISLEDATSFRLGAREVSLVVLKCMVENREETFVGASFVGARPSEASARATLDALNRRIYMLSTQAPRQSDESDALG